MKVKTWQKYIRTVLRIVLTIACVVTIGFIFSNSLKTAEQSSAQSSTVVETVQKVAQVIAPESKIATATGEEYEALHELIRAWAHFAEFFLLGVLFGWCYCSYTLQKKYWYIPTCSIVAVPVIDEILQIFSEGRGVSILDVLTDIGGGMVGLTCAVASVVIGILIYKKQVENRKNKVVTE